MLKSLILILVCQLPSNQINQNYFYRNGLNGPGVYYNSRQQANQIFYGGIRYDIVPYPNNRYLMNPMYGVSNYRGGNNTGRFQYSKGRPNGR